MKYVDLELHVHDDFLKHDSRMHLSLTLCVKECVFLSSFLLARSMIWAFQGGQKGERWSLERDGKSSEQAARECPSFPIMELISTLTSHHLPIISCCNLHVLTDQKYNTVSTLQDQWPQFTSSRPARQSLRWNGATIVFPASPRAIRTTIAVLLLFTF